MKPFIACALAVALWAGVDAFAQGKGQGKRDQTQTQENVAKANKAREDAQGAAEKDLGKGGKRAKKSDEDAAASKQKQEGPKGPKGKGAEQPSDALEKGKAKGKGGEKQLQAFQKQLQHEQAKHMERHARLVRIRELAAQKGDAETVARVEKLMQKEQQVHDRKVKHLQGQPRATPQAPTDTKAGAPAPVAPGPAESPAGVPDAEKEARKRGPSKRNN